jgi:hypothetical protein
MEEKGEEEGYNLYFLRSKPVLRFWICRIFMGLLDPDPDPL